jgi:hypothetical protein
MATKMVRVVATAVGHDGVAVRQPGEEFDVPESLFDKRAKKDDKGKDTDVHYEPPSWFERVAERPATPAPLPHSAKAAGKTQAISPDRPFAVRQRRPRAAVFT